MEKIIFLFVVSVSVLANGQSRDASIRAHQSQKLKNTNSKESIQWKIESETKNLNDYRLQKATAMFEGRELTAWFIDFPQALTHIALVNTAHNISDARKPAVQRGET